MLEALISFLNTFILLLFVSIIPLRCSANNDELNIYNAIFTNYNKNVRPPRDENEKLIVNVGLRYLVMLHMDQKEELFIFSSDFEITWIDSRLKWDASAYGGRSEIMVPETLIWRTDVTVYSSISQEEVIDESRRLVQIGSNGMVTVSNPSVYTCRCKLDVRAFPFDEQRCSVNMSSWAYDSSEMNITTSNIGSEMVNDKDSFTGNSEWNIVNIDVLTLQVDDTDKEPFSELHYVVDLHRRPAYYVYVLYLPTFIVTLLSITGLFTPFNNEGERVERVTLGLTTLLSLAVMLTIVGSDMPKSTRLPGLGTYVLAEIILVSIGVLVTIILLLIHQRISTRMHPRVFSPQLPASSATTLSTTPSRRLSKHHHRSRLSLATYNSSNMSNRPHPGAQLLVTLQDVLAHMQNYVAREAFRLKWVKIFDKIDLVCLFIFQLANIVLTICYMVIH